MQEMPELLNESDKTEQIISRKLKSFQVWKNDLNCEVKRSAYSRAISDIQRLRKEVKNNWWTVKAWELRRLADFLT